MNNAEMQIQNNSARTSAAQASVQALYQELMNIAEAPLTRLLELTTEFQNLQQQLTDAQVASIVSRLQAALIAYRTRLTTYQGTLTTLRSRITNIGNMRDSLQRSCPIV